MCQIPLFSLLKCILKLLFVDSSHGKLPVTQIHIPIPVGFQLTQSNDIGFMDAYKPVLRQDFFHVGKTVVGHIRIGMCSDSDVVLQTLYVPDILEMQLDLLLVSPL